LEERLDGRLEENPGEHGWKCSDRQIQEKPPVSRRVITLAAQGRGENPQQLEAEIYQQGHQRTQVDRRVERKSG
jgi:hypothetical protein